jgi:flavodoxin
MKPLIVFYSFTHNNNLLAKHLQSELSCDVLEIQEQKKRKGISILLDLLFNRTPDIKTYLHQVAAYDHCILISPIWAGKLATPLKSFLLKEKDNIKDYSFITVCGGGNPSQKEKLATQLTRLLSHRAAAICELWINDRLPKAKQDTIKYTSGYRIDDEDLHAFSEKINRFLKSVGLGTKTTRRYTYSN